MKVYFHLYSAHANCKHCMHLFHKMDQSASGPGHCSIIGSDVEDDYYCSFYHMKPEENINIKYTPAKDGKPTDAQLKGFTDKQTKQNKENKAKPKKL